MCGRYAQYTPIDQLASQFGVRGAVPNTAPSWNVASTNRMPVVRTHPETGERHIDLLQWGLVPRWAKDPKSTRQPINARAETVATTPMFRDAYKARRCIVPADAYYEWQTTEAGKQPFAAARTDGTPLAFAGLWEGWKSPDGEILRTYALLTTEPNSDVAFIHDRMPVVLEPDAWAVWLGEEEGDVSRLLGPAPLGALHAWRVGRAVGSVRNDGPDLLAPA